MYAQKYDKCVAINGSGYRWSHTHFAVYIIVTFIKMFSYLTLVDVNLFSCLHFLLSSKMFFGYQIDQEF